MDNSPVPKEVLYGRTLYWKKTRCSYLGFKDVCKRNMKAMNSEPSDWEKITEGQSTWKKFVRHSMKPSEEEEPNMQRKKKKKKIRTLHHIQTVRFKLDVWQVCPSHKN